MRDQFDLTGVRAVVTGAGRGIGEAIARAYAERGAAVVVGARSEREVADVASSIYDAGGTAFPCRVDVTDEASVGSLAEFAASVLGGSVNVLVNNAGTYVPNRFLDYEMEDWLHTLDVNLLGTVRATRAFLQAMLDGEGGRIINVASTAGKYGSLNQSAYNASKHAVVGLTRCLALETAARGVRVTAICPGFVDTPLLIDSPLQGILGVDESGMRKMIDERTPIGRVVAPEEVAALAVYLASPAADAMTGVALTLAGGLILI